MRYWVITKKTLIIAVLAILAIIVGLFLIVGTGETAQTSAAKKKLPIYCTQQDDKIASLSFDAAWGNEDTQQLIDILGKYNVKATFFVVGEWVDKYPESVKALSDAGHEIQNHSNTHPHMPQLSREGMAAEIKACNDKIEAITGKRPTLFRAPYGDYCDALIEVLAAQGMYCIQWDVDSLDWKDKTATQIFERVTDKVQNGSIVLFHNAAKNTPEALPGIIETLQTGGFKLVPITQQVHSGSCTINHEGRQIPDAAPIVTTAPGTSAPASGSPAASTQAPTSATAVVTTKK